MVALPLLVTRAEDLGFGLTLFERQTALGAFDSVLAAVALTHRVDALVSADRAFSDVPELPWVDPATPELDEPIGG